MFDFFTNLFNTDDFPPRWQCGNWTDVHGWLHIISDFATFGAYITIPFVLIYFLRRRPDIPFPRIFYLFAGFIFACGTVHLIEATIFWWPIYRVSGAFKLATATVSWATVAAIVTVAPRALTMRSAEELEREIDERKRIESDLRETEKRYRSLFDSISDMVQSVGPDGRIQFVNPAWLKTLGYTTEEAKGLLVFDVLHPDCHQHCRQAMASLASGLDVGRVQVTFVTKNGRTIPVEGNITSRFVNGKFVATHGFFRDVSERKAAEEFQKQLVKSERLSAIGEAMTGLVHESRNALARSQAGLKLLAREIEDRPELFRFIDESLAAQKDVQQLFEQVRQYAVPPKIEKKMVQVTEVVEEIWKKLEGLRAEHDAELVQDTEGVDVQCCLDVFTIGNVFRNLIENSLVACSDPVSIRLRYRETHLNGTAALEITFRDNGPGLNEAQAKRAFEPFYTTKTHGTGLGLAISRRSVERHNGNMVLRPNDSGAEFVITLPRDGS